MADLVFDCPECSHELIVDAQAAGMMVPCPECGASLLVPKPEEVAAEEAAAEPVPVRVVSEGEAAAPEAVPAPELAPVRVEYRVVSLLEGEGAEGKITAAAVEQKLTELLQEGWFLRTAATVQARDWLGNNPRQELLLMLERQM
jgi:DNA-directed RNA polymerase subunit RPC12/RpoP